MIKVIGIGAGGHAKVVIEILRLAGGWEIVALLDANAELWGKEVLGVPVLGSDDLLVELHQRGVDHAFIGLGTVGKVGPRRQLYEKARGAGLQIVAAIHPRATIAASVELGHGPTIMAGAVLNAATRIGDDVIVNTGAIVEHDCILENHVHVASGARLAGTVIVGEGAHIGAGATVRQCISIGRGAVIGAGAVVVKDVEAETVVVGVPARVLEGLRTETSPSLSDQKRV